MKKLICATLVLLFVIGSLLAFASCGTSQKANIPDGYKLYDNGSISFAYPDDWSMTDGSVGILVNPTGIGNNITITYSDESDIYKTMDIDSFNDLIAPQLVAAGMDIYTPTVQQLKNGIGTNVTKIHFTTIMYDISMEQTMFVLNSDSKTYIITITEIDPDTKLVQTVFDTLSN